MFNLVKFILCFGIFFWSIFSYGEIENSFPKYQTNDQPASKTTSLLSIKLDPVIIFISWRSLKVGSIVPISLELQTPFLKSEKLKWIASVGGSFIIPFDLKEINFNLLAEIGLKYKFQPWAVSLVLGSFIPIHRQEKKGQNYKVELIVPYIKLSAGRNIGNIHIALTASTALIINFLGVSVSAPIHKW